MSSPTVRLTLNGRDHEIAIGNGDVTVDGRRFSVQTDREVHGDDGSWVVVVDGRPYRVDLPEPGEAPFGVRVDGSEYTVSIAGAVPEHGPKLRQLPPPSHMLAEPGSVVAPMAGRIVRLAVEPGASVEIGDLLLILEAMKMENEIRAPISGSVAVVHVAPGQRVAEGATLLALA